MKTLARLFAWFRMRALETTVDGMSDCLQFVRDPETVNRIILAQIEARKSLREARREYMGLRREDRWSVTV